MYNKFKQNIIMSTITETLLIRIEPIIVELLEKYEQFYLKNDMRWSKYDEEMKRLDLTLNMLRSIVTYTKQTDVLGKFTIRKSKGELIIDATIIRDDIEHHLSTEIIYAGGYNVQRLHYRYITKTNLKNEKNISSINYLQEKIKKLTKIQKLQNEIHQYDTRIKTLEQTIEERNNMSDIEILQTSQSYKWLILKHEEINRDSHNWLIYGKNHIGWEDKQEKERQKYIEDFKRRTSSMTTRDIKSYKKYITKLQSKIEEINS